MVSRWRHDTSSEGLSARNSCVLLTTACSERSSVESRAKSSDDSLQHLYKRHALRATSARSPTPTPKLIVCRFCCIGQPEEAGWSRCGHPNPGWVWPPYQERVEIG